MQHNITLEQPDFDAVKDGQQYLFITQPKAGYRTGDTATLTLKASRSQIAINILKTEAEHVNGKYIFIWFKETGREMEDKGPMLYEEKKEA